MDVMLAPYVQALNSSRQEGQRCSKHAGMAPQYIRGYMDAGEFRKYAAVPEARQAHGERFPGHKGKKADRFDEQARRVYKISFGAL